MAGWTGKLENKGIRNITSNAWSRRLRMSTGAGTYIFPETGGAGTGTWLAGAWNAIREEFIILAPFGSVDEPVVKSQTKEKFDRLQ